MSKLSHRPIKESLYNDNEQEQFLFIFLIVDLFANQNEEIKNINEKKTSISQQYHTFELVKMIGKMEKRFRNKNISKDERDLNEFLDSCCS